MDTSVRYLAKTLAEIDPFKKGGVPGRLPIFWDHLSSNYAQALEAWRGAAQSSVDDAQTRYFVAHLHRLFDPKTEHAEPELAEV